jgi:small GTP-binding protein
MIQKKKICMVGACGVGKTSLVRRFVESLFDESYQTTIGVKIDKKRVQSADGEVMMVIWDLAGEDELAQVRASHLRGAAGYLLVADGSCKTTLATARDLEERIRSAVGAIPFILLINKSDLVDEWEVDDELAEISRLGWRHMPTSAKSGDGVEAAFQELADRIARGMHD